MTYKELRTMANNLDDVMIDDMTKQGKPLLDLTICDFEGFDENWDEVFRDYDIKEVEKLLDIIEKNGKLVDNNLYELYDFGDFFVQVGYSSFDI